MSKLVFNRLVFSKKMLGLLSPFIFCCSASAIVTSQNLEGFTIALSASDYSFKAIAEKGSVGKFMPLIAAKNTTVEIKKHKDNKLTSYDCSSFTFDIKGSFAVCEIASQKMAYTFDINSSSINKYPGNY
ncbi:MAG: hypothetical protein V4736_12910 [Bdellovibrionota bacterium]